MEIDNNTYIYITVLVILIIISIIISSLMSSSKSSVNKREEKQVQVQTVTQNDIKNLPGMDIKNITLSGGISGTSNSTNTASGPKEFKTKSSNTTDITNQ